VRADLRREHEPVSLDPRRPVTVPEHDDVLQAMEKSACAEILSIDAALERTEDGTLGVCEECGHEIEAERFAAVPYATHCVKCGRDG
jgi:RNA polymerase-binding transcription factor DksA